MSSAGVRRTRGADRDGRERRNDDRSSSAPVGGPDGGRLVPSRRRVACAVCLHSGVFFRSQRLAFIGRTNPALAFRFMRRCRKHAVEQPWNGSRLRVCRIASRALYYGVLGMEHVRHRRLAAPEVVLRRLLSLDSVLERPRTSWLPTEAEKVDALTAAGIARDVPKLVIVGDDKQIRPTYPGVDFEDVNRLRERYISELPHPDIYGVDHSLFDLAEIRYGSRIRLREHFRCMPEIIQFSNNLSYANEPLIPLRRYGAGRLEPTVTARHVPDG